MVSVFLLLLNIALFLERGMPAYTDFSLTRYLISLIYAQVIKLHQNVLSTCSACLCLTRVK